MDEPNLSLQTFYKGLKAYPKRSLNRSKAKFNQFEVLEPWEEEQSNFEVYLLKRKLSIQVDNKLPRIRSKVKGYLAPSLLKLSQPNQAPVEKSLNKSRCQLPSLVSIQLTKQKQFKMVIPEVCEFKKSASLPLIRTSKKTLFSQKKSLGLGDLRQQKICEIKDCINSQILRMNDFASLKSKILKI